MSRDLVQIIVNADDLGRHHAINEAIAAGFSTGTITSSTIMANGPAFDNALAIADAHREVSFGVHLNLTEFSPLTDAAELAGLLHPDGTFDRARLEATPWSPSFHRAIVGEWTAQVTRVRDAGVPITHLDSHQHVHTLPQLFLPFKAIQRRFGLRRARGTWSLYDGASVPGRALLMKKAAWTLAFRTVYPTRSPGGFGDFVMFRRAVEEGSYRPRNWPSTLELMVHPDRRHPPDHEETALLQPGWMAALPVTARPAGYGDL